MMIIIKRLFSWIIVVPVLFFGIISLLLRWKYGISLTSKIVKWNDRVLMSKPTKDELKLVIKKRL